MTKCKRCGQNKIAKNNDFNAVSIAGEIICWQCGEAEKREAKRLKEKIKREERK
jgi:hypothetical protein